MIMWQKNWLCLNEHINKQCSNRQNPIFIWDILILGAAMFLQLLQFNTSTRSHDQQIKLNLKEFSNRSFSIDDRQSSYLLHQHVDKYYFTEFKVKQTDSSVSAVKLTCLFFFNDFSSSLRLFQQTTQVPWDLPVCHREQGIVGYRLNHKEEIHQGKVIYKLVLSVD